MELKEPALIDAEEPPDIFSLYEQNIGMLTPMIAEELRDALKVYPENWISDAIKEAVSNNKRKWSYISAILERWTAEGRDDGTYRGDSKKTDPDKYIKRQIRTHCPTLKKPKVGNVSLPYLQGGGLRSPAATVGQAGLQPNRAL